jgi:hypothetical protein
MKILDGKGKGNIAEFGGCNAFFSVGVKNLGLPFLLVFKLQDTRSRPCSSNTGADQSLPGFHIKNLSG